MKRPVAIAIAALMLAWVIFYVARRVKDAVQLEMAAPSEAAKETLFSPVQSRGKGGVKGVETNEALALVPVTPASILDGGWILSFPLVEPHMVLWAFTNNGVSADHAKGLLRPALSHLFAGSVYKDRISHSDVKELEELKRIRESDEYSQREKSGMMTVVAAAYRTSKERWAAERDEWMEEFTSWVFSVGVKDPVALKNDLLLIQPANPPPDPKPAE